MTTTVVTDAGEPIAPASDAQPAGDAAAVDIARIEAARDVELAQINAETTTTIVEAEAEAAADAGEDDDEWLSEQLSGVSASCESLQARLSEMQATLQQMQQAQTETTAMVASLLILLPSRAEPTREAPAMTAENPSDAADGQRANPEEGARMARHRRL